MLSARTQYQSIRVITGLNTLNRKTAIYIVDDLYILENAEQDLRLRLCE